MTSTSNLGYFWGDDEYGLERAADRVGHRVAAAVGSALDAWHVRADGTTLSDLTERVGTAPFFGGGTLVVVTQPMALLRAKDDRAAIRDVVRSVAPGNALVFLHAVDGSGRVPAALEALRDDVAAAGGEARELKAPREGTMARWIEEQATERGMRLGAGAAQELATRIGAFVREGDVDRRRQGHLAVGELEKLRLYRLGTAVSVDDVRALVSELVPGSTWALLDAIATRQTSKAVELLERLVESTPAPVLLAVLHRRIRELIQVADLVASGATPPAIIRELKLKPYPAEKLMQQSRAWTIGELEAALEGLLALDVAIKGRESQSSEGQIRLAFTLWLAEHVATR
ncbi:MAG TPA: DNA polymerase III subunit delta [Candidatus Saccharimonadales bacterium]|nr:DNA polymerase III subunit delta [Candidatus Saccharimonadales bacterium]